MARISHLYPKSPTDVPENLTTPSNQYQTQMVLVLCSLILFFGFYLALVVGSAVMMLVCVLLAPFGLLLIPFFLLCFLFLVKGFFKTGREQEREMHVEITEKDHPKLYAFIEKLCEETNAPFPHRIYLSPEVNAAVFYNESVLSLFLPTPKNLLIGMGLINVLTLSEFKAVLAHEFGHFSQNSMKLHRYVYTANRIIADMVIGRDWLDNMLDRCKQREDALAAFGWVAWSVLWVFRKGLEGCFYGINFLSNSLSRQMEFNADLVAVSVTGSDAIVHALSRLDFATQALEQACADLKVASDHDLYTNDLFYHQNHAAAYLRRVRKSPRLGEPPPLPEDPETTSHVFEEEDDSTPKMWATHPPSYAREQNAKEHYIRWEADGRSPWLLFDDPQALRARVTWRFYRLAFGLNKQVGLDEAGVVQQFIDDERAETTYDPRYHGMYDCRPINPGKIGVLIDTVKDQPWKGPVLANIQARLYNDELKERMQDHLKLREGFDLLDNIKDSGEAPDGDTFKFRGKRYDVDEASRLLKKVKGEYDDDMDYLAELDNRVFRVHYQMAEELGKDVSAELEERYRFHMSVQSIDANICEQRPALQAALNYLSGKSQLEPGAFNEIRTIFREAHEALVRGLNKADNLPMPSLKNVKEGEPLGYFLMDRKVVKGLRPSAQTLTVKWICKFMEQIDQVREKIRRVHFKSLGGILALQEKIGKRWADELASVPDVMTTDVPAPVKQQPPRR